MSQSDFSVPTDVYRPQKINQVLSQINRVRVLKISRHEAEGTSPRKWVLLMPQTEGCPTARLPLWVTWGEDIALVHRDWCHAAPKIAEVSSLYFIHCFLMEGPSRFLTPLPGALPSALIPALFPVTEISTLPQLPPWTSCLHPQPDSESLEGKTRLYSLRLWVQEGGGTLQS